MLVWSASYPRSGNTLVWRTLRLLFQVPVYTIYDPHWGQVAPADGSLPWDDCETGDRLAFLKTHEVDNGADSRPAIYLVRDGRDSYVSYAHLSLHDQPKELGHLSYAEVLEMLVRSTSHFGSWSSNVESWTNRAAPTAVVRFEDLIQDPVREIAAAAEKLGVHLPEPRGSHPSFETLHRLDPRLYRKGKVGSWREEMPASIEALFWERHGPTMERLGYPR